MNGGGFPLSGAAATFFNSEVARASRAVVRRPPEDPAPFCFERANFLFLFTAPPPALFRSPSSVPGTRRVGRQGQKERWGWDSDSCFFKASLPGEEFRHLESLVRKRKTLARIRHWCGEVGPVQALERKARSGPPWVVHHREDLALHASLFRPPGKAGNWLAGDREFRLGRFTNGLLGNRLDPAKFKDSPCYERTFGKGGSPRSNHAFCAFTTFLRRRPLAARQKNSMKTFSSAACLISWNSSGN